MVIVAVAVGIVALVGGLSIGFLSGSRRLREPKEDAPVALSAPWEPEPVGGGVGGPSAEFRALAGRVEALEIAAETRHQQVLGALRSATARLNGSLGGRPRKGGAGEEEGGEDVDREQLAQLGLQLQHEMAGRNGAARPPQEPLSVDDRLRRLRRGGR